MTVYDQCYMFIGKVTCHEVTFYVQNKCPFPIWPAVAPNSGHPVLASGGFYLPCGNTRRIDVPWGWNGRIWARTGCDFTSNWNQACETGNCNFNYFCVIDHMKKNYNIYLKAKFLCEMVTTYGT